MVASAAYQERQKKIRSIKFGIPYHVAGLSTANEEIWIQSLKFVGDFGNLFAALLIITTNFKTQLRS
jgi:hypothetical protein